ncbi:MAG: hypothetical protein KME40_09760 [Komarekiella atlantica HA4396-MV6]|nr:hypothetical protein [Komarekiella atlantica HA4396-MV6]
MWAGFPRHWLQRGGSRVGGFPDLNGLPWEPSVRAASLLGEVLMPVLKS